MLAFVPAVREFSVFAHTIYFGLATRDDHYPVCRLDIRQVSEQGRRNVGRAGGQKKS